MSNSLVLGLGNRLSGADAFGPAVVEWLRCAVDLPPSVHLIDAHTDLLAYIDQFAQYEQVVLVDAVIATTGGGVQVFEEATFSAWEDTTRGAHELSPLLAVKLFRKLRGEWGDRGPGLSGCGSGLSGLTPVITLVANVVREDEFRRLPTHVEIGAGTTAVRRVLNAPAVRAPLGSAPALR